MAKCKYCNTEHPQEYIANPNYCISRMEEQLDDAANEIKSLRAELAKYKLQLSAAREGLKKFEWIYTVDPFARCYVCGMQKSLGKHGVYLTEDGSKDCWLSALLMEE